VPFGGCGGCGADVVDVERRYFGLCLISTLGQCSGEVPVLTG
jgi:hypothetical protein